MGVLINPGWIELTRIPLGPQPPEQWIFVSPPHRELGGGVAVAGDRPGHALDGRDVLTIDPRPASFIGFTTGADSEEDDAGQVDVEDAVHTPTARSPR